MYHNIDSSCNDDRYASSRNPFSHLWDPRSCNNQFFLPPNSRDLPQAPVYESESESRTTSGVRPSSVGFFNTGARSSKASQHQDSGQHHTEGSTCDESSVKVAISIARPMSLHGTSPLQNARSGATRLQFVQGNVSATIAFIPSWGIAPNPGYAERVPIEFGVISGKIDIDVTYPRQDDESRATLHRAYMKLSATASSGSIKITLPQAFCLNGNLLLFVASGGIDLRTTGDRLPKEFEFQVGSGSISVNGQTTSNTMTRSGRDPPCVQGDLVVLRVDSGNISVRFQG